MVSGVWALDSRRGRPAGVSLPRVGEDDTSRGEQARERLAAIGEIAAEVAHELRNTLQVIAASAYLARQDPPQSLPHIQKIERNARLAHAIVDDLMSLARGEPAHAEPVLFAEVMVAARADLAPEAASWDDRVTPSDLRVRAHTGLLTRLVHVLYENAICACQGRAPAITTRAWAERARVVIEVADDGPGVAADIAPRIFDPLVTGRSGGTGLGLALAKRIVAAHSGSIALVSGAGAGATFRVELPSSATAT
jgi:signal transduction histidine kinase